jgi:hypothetical protein
MTQAASLTIATAARPGGAGRTDPVALLASPAPALSELRETLEDLSPRASAALLERLVHERVDGLAWRNIAALPAGAVDPWLRATLRRRHQARAAATLTQGLVLAEILEALHRAGIPVAVHRGLRAVEWIYKDAGARPFTDHDLLIRPPDAFAAGAVLARLGFEAISESFFRRATVFVDLHTDPLGARRRPSRARLFPIDTDALFREAGEGLVAGAPAILLRPEDEVVLLAIHVVKHSFDRLIRTADLAHLLALDPLGVRPPDVLACDEGSLGGLERLLLGRVRSLRPLPYAGEILMALQAASVADRVRFAWDALFPHDGAPDAPVSRHEREAAGSPHVAVFEEAACDRRDRRAA